MEGPVLFVAVHLGPYLSIAPLAEEFGNGYSLFFVEGVSRDARQASGLVFWDSQRVCGDSGTLDRFLKAHGVQAIICSTSEGLLPGNIEEQVSLAAAHEGIPLFVIEDFPGNYRHRPGARLDGLFVEDEMMRDVHASHDVSPGLVHCVCNPRYDGVRAIDREALRATTRSRLGLGEARVVLWAGQPEVARSYEALARLVSYLAKTGATLLFKAHPRERAYHEGAYTPLLAAIRNVVDVTHERETVGLCCAADLVITQFSSVGVEAGYLGTPALFVLFNDLGKTYLRMHKGYETVPWVARDCAFVAGSDSELANVLDTALFNESARARVRDNFGRWYGAKPAGSREVATIIRESVGSRI